MATGRTIEVSCRGRSTRCSSGRSAAPSGSTCSRSTPRAPSSRSCGAVRAGAPRARARRSTSRRERPSAGDPASFAAVVPQRHAGAPQPRTPRGVRAGEPPGRSLRSPAERAFRLVRVLSVARPPLPEGRMPRMSPTQATQPPSTSRRDAEQEPLVSVVIPCLNEAENIEACVARRARRRSTPAGLRGEVIVADNGSEDDSAELARGAGRHGGAASAAAATAAPTSPASPRRAGRYIVMADADLTYDFNEIPRFVRELEEGADFVVGRPDGQHPPRRDALAAPLRGQPGAHAACSTSSTGPASRTPTAGCAALRRDVLPAPGPALHGHGVRLRDGDPGGQGEPRDPAVPDRVPPARRGVEARRASATAGATCASCWCTAPRTCS